MKSPVPSSRVRIFPGCIGLCSAVAVVLIAGLSAGFAAEKDRPSFVVILCDDLGYSDLACYGHPSIRTPNLDRLASEGLRLTDCYSASPLCSPARCGLLTGRTPSRCGIYSWIAAGNPMHLSPNETTIATLLRDAGYDTAIVGKWHLNGHFNSPRHTQPDDHGFDHWFATQNNAAPSHENPTNFVRNGERVGPLDGYSCQIVADEAINWLRSRHVAGETLPPFFLYACFHEPHEPIASPTEIVQHYPDASRPGEAEYYANVENMDRAVGRLMRALDELGAAEDTLVFFTSDNGPETLDRYRGAARSHGSPGPLRGMKLHIYEGGIRVPGILRWPGWIAPGSESGEPVSALDVLPTLCELAGITPPADRPLDGASFAPIFRGEAIERARPLFWHYYGAPENRQVAVREGDWKLVAGWDQGPDLPTGGSLRPGIVEALKDSRLVHFELYNVREDIGEMRDLSKDQPERLERMRTMARQLYREVIEEGPEWSFPD